MSFRNLFIKYFFSILSFLIVNLTYSQDQQLVNVDSLKQLSLQVLLKEFNSNFQDDFLIDHIYANVILDKLKQTKSDTKIATGYNMMVSLYPDNEEMQIKYLDSAILYGEKSKYKFYPTKFYRTRGAIYADQGFFSKALNSYVKGIEYAQEKNDLKNKFILTHNIALLKRKLGRYDEAKYLFKKCLVFELEKQEKSEIDSIGYLITLADLVTTYLRNKEIDSAIIDNRKGIKISQNLPVKDLFTLNKGIINYYKKNYSNSISDIRMVLSELSVNGNTYFSNYNVIDAYYFLGKSFEATNRNEKAIFYYKKIDSLVLETNYLVPEVRPAYNAIIKYYRSLGDKTNQLHYINRLLYNDSILDYKFNDLNDRIIKDYDTPNLLLEKEELITDLETKNSRSNYALIISITVVCIVSIFLVLNYKKRKLYKVRFENLISKIEGQPSIKAKTTKQVNPESDIGIAEDVVSKILNGLTNFEEKHGFTKINLTSSSLAQNLKTNPKYLTKVIKHYKQKNFSPYINDLRIDYIIDRLKTDQKLRQYTIKAIAVEAGFNSAEVFSKYFYRKTGIYPSYFIKNI